MKMSYGINPIQVNADTSNDSGIILDGQNSGMALNNNGQDRSMTSSPNTERQTQASETIKNESFNSFNNNDTCGNALWSRPATKTTNAHPFGMASSASFGNTADNIVTSSPAFGTLTTPAADNQTSEISKKQTSGSNIIHKFGVSNNPAFGVPSTSIPNTTSTQVLGAANQNIGAPKSNTTFDGGIGSMSASNSTNAPTFGIPTKQTFGASNNNFGANNNSNTIGGAFGSMSAPNATNPPIGVSLSLPAGMYELHIA
ncbi:nuclear pore complex protein NUP98A-like [Vanessa cardui]|uniref:nuclear pore complex protein NUP98A-like n=1 Tax=Vanessa cardui TaxID=171605 RepID=UPI001F134519|nr:nuclear pore complex protein NUP98A-like [Vanessa cardui]